MTPTQIQEEINREVSLLPPDEERQVLSFIRALRSPAPEWESPHPPYPYEFFFSLLKERLYSRNDSGEASDEVETEIYKMEGVNGGTASIGATRIAVWMLEEARREGLSDREILNMSPQLRAIHLVMAWLYVATHQREIDQEIQKNDEAWDSEL